MQRQIPQTISLFMIFNLALPLNAQLESRLTAWDTLIRENAALIDKASSLEQEILMLVTAEQVADYLDGASAAEIVMLNGETLEAFLARKGVGSFDIDWDSIDGGGGTGMVGGELALIGTIGQTDTRRISGGEFTLTGGFLAVMAGSTAIFSDSFESGGTAEWTSTTGG